MIVSMAITNIVRDQPMELIVAEALMIVLGHYFSTRRLVNIPPEVLEQLTEQGLIPRERYPLYLPRFSVRGIIVLSFLGAAAYLYQERRLFTPQALGSVGLVLAYFLGVMVRGVSNVLWRWRPITGLMEWFADLRAIVVLGATATLTVYHWLDRADDLPHWAQSAILSLLLFYFGAR
jgi:hypothetical protein